MQMRYKNEVYRLFHRRQIICKGPRPVHKSDIKYRFCAVKIWEWVTILQHEKRLGDRKLCTT